MLPQREGNRGVSMRRGLEGNNCPRCWGNSRGLAGLKDKAGAAAGAGAGNKDTAAKIRELWRQRGPSEDLKQKRGLCILGQWRGWRMAQRDQR